MALRAGTAALAALLSDRDGHARWTDCEFGAQARFHDRRRKRVVTALGAVELQRDYFVCPGCRRGQSHATASSTWKARSFPLACAA